MKNFWVNPVLNKEIMLRMRSFKTFIGIFFYLLVLSAIALIVISLAMRSNSGLLRPDDTRMMFYVLSFAQLGLILFITPGLTAGIISGERERQTLNILLTTVQSSSSIIISKLVASLLFLMLMILSSLPIYSIVFLFGGVSPGMVVKTFIIYFFTMFTVGSFGIMFSTLTKKTIVSMIATYGLALFLVGGLSFILVLSMEFFFNWGQNQTSIWPYITTMVNPVMVMFMWIEEHAAEDIFQRSGISFPLLYSFMISHTILSISAIAVAVRKLRPSMKLPKGTK